MLPKIGILGFGIVGKSALNFLQSTHSRVLKPSSLSVWDKRLLERSELDLIAKNAALYMGNDTESFNRFLSVNDYIIVSPGIDLRLYDRYKDKFLCELDIFARFFSKSVVAITGTLGKTSTTQILAHLMKMLPLGNAYGAQHTARVIDAGNIGTGMLDIVAQQQQLDTVVLELSSFQLEYSKEFAPDLAVWTNLYPNHLDRHSTMDDYFEAKFKLIRYQKEHQVALVSSALVLDPAYEKYAHLFSSVHSQLCFIHTTRPSAEQKARLLHFSSVLFFCEKDVIYLYQNGNEHKLFDMNAIPCVGHKDNWIFIIAALYIRGYDLEQLYLPQRCSVLADIKLDAHRLEKCATINGVDFYDDSKATIKEATAAAVSILASLKRPIILMIGGVGKGVDRSSFVHEIATHSALKKVICFGKECLLFQSCESYDSLPAALEAVMKIARQGDIVLFSPSGASFDFFSNYRQRGEVFKELVKRYEKGSGVS